MLELALKSRRGSFDITAEFNLKSGVTALIGPSGSGKSSVLRLVAGLDRPDQGKIVFNGKIWADSESKKFVGAHKRHIGMVFQTGLLLAHRSVADNIALGARGGELDKNLLEMIGCMSLMGRPVAGLSGGEQQRVMLGRALAGNPQLLLLDEPLSALDPEGRTEVLELLARLLPTLDIPVLYVTHAFEEAARLAREFIRMVDGHIVAQGSAVKVLANSSIATRETAISSVIKGQVTSLEQDEIARISVGGQMLEMTSAGLKTGDPVYLRLWARDLILAHNKPEGISARNALAGHVGQLSPLANGQVLVSITVEGAKISALVMARTASEMKIRLDQPIFLIFKSASIEPAG
ncbi:hypothetical protein MNBD_ALPHA12-1996 [hydrothermal vent metagenome]|uniref:Molybdenum ABC transporter ATP-binding protein ModC n=1 Tax=hydrothermal vent metagenome TaxID=652676 RepID=A0A3B0TW91_9ZZZZ